MRLSLSSALFVALIACQSSNQGPAMPDDPLKARPTTHPSSAPSSGPASASGPLKSWGSLHAMMHEGRTEAAVTLKEALPGPGVYAVGALEGLRGEVTVVDGEIWVSRPGTDAPETVHGPESDESAALLVQAHVTAWKRVEITRDIAWSELDAWVASIAGSKEPFVFVVEGPMSALSWHVIDGRKLPKGPSSHEAHQKASQHATEAEVSGTLVGFWSDRHQGVFTHHDRQTHIHVVLTEPFLTGHVDEVTLKAGSVLKVASSYQAHPMTLP